MISNVVTKSSPFLEEERLYAYRAYGLNIHSALLLPELVVGEGEADVVVRFGKVGFSLPETNGAKRCLCGTAKEVYLFWKEIGTFFVRDGCEIIIDPAPGVEERILRLVIVGPALSVLLHQRGVAVFHASAVAFPAGAVAFLAQKGHGKSTMAAALHVRGYDLIADDFIGLDNEGSHFMVRPGFPQFKLWPESVEAIGETPEALPLLRPNFSKRAHRVSQGFVSKSLPLRCVFVLDVDPNLEIIPLPPKEAWLKVMPHWYGALFQGELLKVFGLDTQLYECTNLVQKASIYALRRPSSLAALPEVVQMVEDFLTREVQPTTL